MLRITFKILPSSTLRLGELLMSYFLLLGIVNIRTSCGEFIRHPALPRGASAARTPGPLRSGTTLTLLARWTEMVSVQERPPGFQLAEPL